LQSETFQCGMVTLLGRPNVGKSTLLNSLIGQDISATANKPQTTRNQIRGILTQDNFQIVFLDTPGIHKPKTKLHSRIVEYAKEGARGTDLILFLTEPEKNQQGVHPGDAPVLEHIQALGVPAFCVVNKTDAHPDEQVLACLKAYQEVPTFQEFFPISAKSGKGIKELLKAVVKRLPLGPPLFDPELITDLPERMIAAEFVREQIHQRCHQEVPYGVAVEVESFVEEGNLIRIHCLIHVERESHKGIILGKGGKMIKEIGSFARVKMEYLLGQKVFLGLQVKVAGDWYNQPHRLDELGYPAPVRKEEN